MAYFAEIDDDGIVLRVLLVPATEAHRGAAFLRDDLGLGGAWVRTSMTGDFRRRFAGPGMRYDPARDAFVLPQPHASWVLDAVGDWQPPRPVPEGDGWVWQEPDGWVRQASSAKPS